MATTNVPVTLDTPIVIKVLFRGQTKKFKLPLKDLGAHVLPAKLRSLLQVKADEEVLFERYSDSSASYVTLDADKPQVYKTLFRAAKAKLKLRLRATVPAEQSEQAELPMAPVSPVIARSPNADATPTKLEPVSPVSPPKSGDVEDEAPLPCSFTARHGKKSLPMSKTKH
jgi:next-to-BRCA1 protein 1